MSRRSLLHNVSGQEPVFEITDDAVSVNIKTDFGLPNVNYNCVQLSSDRTKLYVLGGGNVYQFSINGDLSTLSYNGLSFSSGVSDPRGIQLTSDNTKIFVGGFGAMRSFNINDPNDISTAVYTGKQMGFSAGTYGSDGYYLMPDNKTIFSVENGEDYINEYKMTTALDPSTGSYTGNRLDIASQDVSGAGLFFITDEIFLVIGSTSMEINEFRGSGLSVNGFSFSGNTYSVSSSRNGITADRTLKKLYTVQANGVIHQYSYNIA